MTKKSVLAKFNPGTALFDTNYKLYNTVDAYNVETSGRPHRTLNELKDLAREETVFSDDERFNVILNERSPGNTFKVDVFNSFTLE